MGSETLAESGPVVEGEVEGTAPLVSVEVVKMAGGNFPTVHRATVNGNKAKVWWKDPGFRSDTLYSLRVTQQVAPDLAARYAGEKENPFPSEMAWSSPVWVSVGRGPRK